jgi:hypothetical protein
MAAVLQLECFYEYAGISKKEQKDLDTLLEELADAGISGTVLIPETQLIPDGRTGGFRVRNARDLFLKLYVPEDTFHRTVDILGQEKFLSSSIHTEPSITDYLGDDLAHDKGLTYDFKGRSRK